MTFLEVLEDEAAQVAAGTAEVCGAAHFELTDVACERISTHFTDAEMVRDMHAGHIDGQWTTWAMS